MVKLADDSSEYRIVLGYIDSIVRKSPLILSASGTFSQSADGGVARGPLSHRSKGFEFLKGWKQRPTDIPLSEHFDVPHPMSDSRLSRKSTTNRSATQPGQAFCTRESKPSYSRR